MPINYKLYPSNWKTEIRPAILARANHCCEFCGIKNYSIGFRDNDGVFHLGEGKLKIVLTVAHLDHDISNNDHLNLRALCQKCHLLYDKEHHRKSRIRNKLTVL